jgi:hypothetical protein
MIEENYSLSTILSALTKTNKNSVNKRLVYDQAPLGGISVKWVIAFCLSLPILLYAGIFNESMFNLLGIAQAIIFFVVFLSMVMIIVVAVTFINNNRVIRDAEPSWNKLFDDVDLRLVLSGGRTPYKDFFKYYGEAVEKKLEGKALETYMVDAISQMKKDNADLLNAMNSARTKR